MSGYPQQNAYQSHPQQQAAQNTTNYVANEPNSNNDGYSGYNEYSGYDGYDGYNEYDNNEYNQGYDTNQQQTDNRIQQVQDPQEQQQQHYQPYPQQQQYSQQEQMPHSDAAAPVGRAEAQGQQVQQMNQQMNQQPQQHIERRQSRQDVSPCSSVFVESTMNCFPGSRGLEDKCHLSFGLLTTPLANGHVLKLPSVNFGRSGVIRCRLCRGYINGYVGWYNNGQQWKCNLCMAVNDIPKEYYCQLDSTQNRRMDHYDRVELCNSSYEIEAPDEYCIRPPQPPCYIFVINVNKQSILTNCVSIICESILANLELLAKDERTMIGIMTYDESIHYYQFKQGQKSANILKVSDCNDVILPIPGKELITNLYENYNAIYSLISNLSSMYDGSNNTVKLSDENCLGSAITAASEMSRSIGGKILLFSYGLPTIGMGKVGNRENDAKLHQLLKSGNVNELNKQYHLLMKRKHNYYLDFGLRYSQFQLNCDLFQFSDGSYCDIATLKGAVRSGGGELLFYNRFNAKHYRDAVYNDLTRILTRYTGWEACLRIRCSKDVKISKYYGCFYRRSPDLLSLPTIDSGKTLAVSLTCASNENVIKSSEIFVQIGLLYTTSEGRRRIRVHTISYPVTHNASELFNSVNVMALCAMIAKEATIKMVAKDIQSARLFIQDSCVTGICSLVRLLRYQSVREADLPESVRFWPLLTLGLLKCIAFADIRDVFNYASLDTRSSLLVNILSMNTNHLELFIRPSLLDIKELFVNEAVGCYQNENDSAPLLPNECALTEEAMKQDGLYLLDNGQYLVIWVGINCSSDILKLLFGVTQLHETKATQLTLTPIDENTQENSELYRLWTIISYLRSINYRYQPLWVMTSTQKVFSTLFLIRSRTESVMNYQEFMAFIQKLAFQPNAPKN